MISATSAQIQQHLLSATTISLHHKQSERSVDIFCCGSSVLEKVCTQTAAYASNNKPIIDIITLRQVLPPSESLSICSRPISSSIESSESLWQHALLVLPLPGQLWANMTSSTKHEHNNNNIRLTALCLGLPGWAGTRKVKPIWILLKQETLGGSYISWTICRSTPRPRQIPAPAPHHSISYRPDVLPATQPTVSKHWRNYPQNLKHITDCIVITGGLSDGHR